MVPIAGFSQHPEQVAYFEAKADWWEGKDLPDFYLQDDRGRTIRKEDLLGEVTVLHFFYTDCPACDYEANKLNRVVKRFSKAPVNFLAFSFDTSVRTRTYRDRTGFLYRVVPDAKQFIQQDMEVGVFPTHMVVNGDGEVTEVILGNSVWLGWRLKRAIRRTVRKL